MEIKENDRVYLKQLYVKNGNPYYAGNYLARELPKETWNEKYIILPEQPVPNSSYANALKKQTIAVSNTKPIAQKAAYGTPPPAIVNNDDRSITVPSSSSPTPPVKVEINTATAEEISGKLEGIGMATATKIIDARIDNPFKDLADIKERIKLPNNGSWEKIADSLLFKGVHKPLNSIQGKK